MSIAQSDINQRVVYLNGNFIPEIEARISIYDTALATGEVVTEVTRTFNHRPFRLETHLERLYRGLAKLHIDPGLTGEDIQQATLETLTRNLPTEGDDVDWQIIHYVSRGLTPVFELFAPHELHPTVIIHCFPLINRLGRMARKYHAGIDLVVPPQRAIPSSVLSPEIKSRGRLDYLVARIQAAHMVKGASGILLGHDGYLIEGTGTSLFVVHGTKILTPPGPKVLRGITRSVVLDIARKVGIPIEEAELTLEDAKNAHEIFVTSTVICLLHARSFEGKTIGDSTCGPITTKIREAFKELVGLDFVEQAERYALRLTSIVA